ncbi:MAG: retropepsin-like aspartic protease, partial [Sulfobacillus sp.]
MKEKEGSGSGVSAAVNSAVAMAHAGGHEPIYVVGQVAGLPCSVLIDTGAGVSLVNREWLKRTGIRTKLEAYTGPVPQGVNGQQLLVDGQLCLQIGLGTSTAETTLLVASVLPADVLLGTGALACFGTLSVDWNRRTMQVNEAEELAMLPAPAPETRDPMSSVTIHRSEEVVPAWSFQWVLGKVKGEWKQAMYLEGHRRHSITI